MQNYEDLAAALQPMEKALKDSAGTVTRLQKAIQKNTETGNLTEARKNLTALGAAIEQLRARYQDIDGAVGGFDTGAYFASGDFTRQFLDACGERGMDVKGETGVYELFPFKVRIQGDEEHPGEIYMNRKKIPSVRPSYAAEVIRQGQAKLYSAPFRESEFMNELADAYETACLKSGARSGSTQALNKVYRCLAPTNRARREYDQQAYAFDLARLYEAGPEAWVTKDGVHFTFGTSRDGKSGVRVLSRSGVESFISTLRPLMESGDERA